MSEAEESPLGALTPAELALTARHPLPEGVADAVVNKTLLCDALDVSPTTLSNWIRAGLPYESAGTNGRSYEFRLSLAFAWAADRRDREDQARQFATDQARQLRLALSGDNSAEAETRARLSPKEQRELIDVERAWMMAAQARGDLIRAAEVTGGLAAAFAAIRDSLDALPDMLARELDLPGQGIEVAERICDEALQSAVLAVKGVIGDEIGAAAEI